MANAAKRNHPETTLAATKQVQPTDAPLKVGEVRPAGAPLVTVRIPERLLDLCFSEAAAVSVTSVQGQIEWEPQGLDGKIVAFSNQCTSCGGVHDILHLPACFCPWCGAEITESQWLMRHAMIKP